MLGSHTRSRSLLLAAIFIGVWFFFGWRIRPLEFSPEILSAKQTPEQEFYHSASESNSPLIQDVPACSPCHGKYPHKKNPSNRAFLNLHLGRLDCAVCHLGVAEARRIVLGSQAAAAYSTVSGGKHEIQFRKPSCRDCHSPEGVARFNESGYDRANTARLNELDEHVSSAVEGNVFYYPRF
ncbi:hypothetical protein HZA56_03275 [Candidatus Poribacteria bacterium]|nr:hypothetical protein [Candidatus Poribacteria bacterium]